ncbi:MAG: methylenetetrahydrofolate--tRNA-(uracil(54)-C(5))-methyltransferase (FADH(2)-oxidizing) TrmFO [Acidobacteria bacterium]|nr:methylenetetrahydrofolate--tRNA-(uracil(54)-C(5))-methyltransferase (FADH(2)-oxidizing) TrmFO [Acidobacteriota bacterium]
MSGTTTVTVIGGGLAGSEAAWQLARRGVPVRLLEMRPGTMTPAHRTGDLAELVCSNSLKSEAPASAVFLLKEELRTLGSLVMLSADETRVPAGHALAVDRERFARRVTEALEGHPLVEVRREAAEDVGPDRPVIVAAGPLASDALAGALSRAAGAGHLYFHDAVSPIVARDSIDFGVAWESSRYGRGGDDYLNCPFDREAYERFLEALLAAEQHPLHAFEEPRFFEGCLPVEELARRGPDTLRFGPLKPVGLDDPRTGRRPWAVLQLRKENALAEAYNLVGFQTNLRYGEQERVFRMIPGLANARFLRLGKMHRNTFVNAPRVLDASLEMKACPGVFLAGQLMGLEGYVEAVATGLLAALQVHRRLRGLPPLLFPRETALGSLQHFWTHAEPDRYQPTNMSFALLPPPEPGLKRRIRGKAEQHAHRVTEALGVFRAFTAEMEQGM